MSRVTASVPSSARVTGVLSRYGDGPEHDKGSGVSMGGERRLVPIHAPPSDGGKVIFMELLEGEGGVKSECLI